MFWHVYLVCTGQTTIEFYNNQRDRMAEKRKGKVWKNDYNLGWRQNWQEVFDEKGPYWWITWALPRRAAHTNEGLFYPTTETLDKLRVLEGKEDFGLAPQTNTEQTATSSAKDIV